MSNSKLTKKYNPEDYPTYNNGDYDFIDVSNVKDIPMDYDGVIAVPITFLDSICQEQFQTVGYIIPIIGFREMYKRLLIIKKENYENTKQN